MAAPTGLRDLPWASIVSWLLVALLIAWLSGFGAGLVIRLVAPWTQGLW